MNPTLTASPARLSGPRSSLHLVPRLFVRGPLALHKFQLFLLALVCCLFQSGCVTGRRNVSLPIPSLSAAAAAKGEISLGAVVDNRRFENKPAIPETPSIDGDALSLTAEQRAAFIGRQRNSYGHAMGDITLPAEDSVTKRARLLFAEALKHRGYQVTEKDGSAGSLDITIDEFRAWFTPGMFSVSFEANIACKVDVKRSAGNAQFVVHGHGLNQGQIASDENWQLAYTRAFENFLSNLDQELTKAGL